MSVGMQLFYRSINTVVTYYYYFCLIVLLSDIVEHKKNIWKTVFIYGGMAIVSSVMTELSVLFPVKIYVQVLYIIVTYRLFLTERAAMVGVYAICFWLFCSSLQEQLIILVCKLNNISPWVDVGHGVLLGKARVLLASSIFMLILTLLLKRFLKQFAEMKQEKNLWFLVAAGCIFVGLGDMVQGTLYPQAEGVAIIPGIFALIGLTVISVMLYTFSTRSLYWEQKQQEEHFKMKVMEKQFEYYRDKQRDEKLVHSLYHDMKNHLLVLEHQIHSPETADMVKKLQRELESYADYVHTGNDFLDVIIKDKARVAREKQINLSVTADLHDMDFIEPLDISTIFGNGLDNAIEASEELPEDQRVIRMKVGRVQNFLSILMENNCGKESISHNNQTSKNDKQQHGFGISNMKKAADKYGGQLITTCEDGKFTLSIMLPIP